MIGNSDRQNKKEQLAEEVIELAQYMYKELRAYGPGVPMDSLMIAASNIMLAVEKDPIED